MLCNVLINYKCMYDRHTPKLSLWIGVCYQDCSETTPLESLQLVWQQFTTGNKGSPKLYEYSGPYPKG